jgi:hypothetical protein
MIKTMAPDTIGYVIIETATTSEDIMPAKIIEKRGDGRVLAEGCLQEANMKNRNGRFYDSRDLFPELVAPRQLELLRTGNMRGENGHPLSKDLVRQQTIDPNNCSVIFTKFWTDGDLVMGNFFGTYNALGEEFNKELMYGLSPSFSMRALGTIKNTNRGAEVKGVKLITYDRVIYPSHNKAYTHGVVSEGSNLLLEENDRGTLIPITNQSVIDYIREESCNIKQIRESFDLLYDDIKLINNKSQVQLTDRAGGVFIVNLENYIHNEIIGACIGESTYY